LGNLFIYVSAYRITQCQNNIIEIGENTSPTIRCEGLQAIDPLNWALQYENGTTKYGYCAGYNSSSPTGGCQSSPNFTWSRLAGSTTYRVHDNNRDLHNAVIRCYRTDLITSDSCRISVKGNTHTHTHTYTHTRARTHTHINRIYVAGRIIFIQGRRRCFLFDFACLFV
jgi:hypothetical protein